MPEPDVRSSCQYSKLLTWSNTGVGVPAILLVFEAALKKYCAVKVEEEVGAPIPIRAHLVPLPEPVGKTNAEVPVLLTGPFTKLLALPPETVADDPRFNKLLPVEII